MVCRAARTGRSSGGSGAGGPRRPTRAARRRSTAPQHAPHAPCTTALGGACRRAPADGSPQPSGSPRDPVVVGRRLGADGRVGPVPRVHHGLVRQREQPGPDGVQDGAGSRCATAPSHPGPPANSVSPLKTVPRSGTQKQTAPGAWPGVCSTCTLDPATSSTIPSSSGPSGGAPGCVRSQSTRSAGCSSTDADSRSASSGADRTWSSWAWVQAMATTVRPPTAAAMAPGVVRRVDDQDLLVVPEQPHVVLDVEGLAVEAERAAGDEVLHTGGHLTLSVDMPGVVVRTTGGRS